MPNCFILANYSQFDQKLGFQFSRIHCSFDKHLFCLAQEIRSSEGQAIPGNLGFVYYAYWWNLALSGAGERFLIHRPYFICYNYCRTVPVYFGMGIFQIVKLPFAFFIPHDSHSIILDGICSP